MRRRCDTKLEANQGVWVDALVRDPFKKPLDIGGVPGPNALILARFATAGLRWAARMAAVPARDFVEIKQKSHAW